MEKHVPNHQPGMDLRPAIFQVKLTNLKFPKKNNSSNLGELLLLRKGLVKGRTDWYTYGYGSIPINTIFRGMNIHLPAVLMFTRGTRFCHTAILMIWSPIIGIATSTAAASRTASSEAKVGHFV